MEEQETENNPTTGVPKQAFEQFLSALKEKNVSKDVVDRLQKTLVEQGDVSEPAVKAALFGDGDTTT